MQQSTLFDSAGPVYLLANLIQRLVQIGARTAAKDNTDKIISLNAYMNDRMKNIRTPRGNAQASKARGQANDSSIGRSILSEPIPRPSIISIVIVPGRSEPESMGRRYSRPGRPIANLETASGRSTRANMMLSDRAEQPFVPEFSASSQARG